MFSYSMLHGQAHSSCNLVNTYGRLIVRLCSLPWRSAIQLEPAFFLPPDRTFDAPKSSLGVICGTTSYFSTADRFDTVQACRCRFHAYSAIVGHFARRQLCQGCIRQEFPIAGRVPLTARSICTLCLVATSYLPRPFSLDRSWQRQQSSRLCSSFTVSAHRGLERPRYARAFLWRVSNCNSVIVTAR